MSDSSIGLFEKRDYFTNSDKPNKNELFEWLSGGHNYQYFVTLTLKKAIYGEQGTWHNITRQDCNTTAWLFRDRLLKKIIPSVAYRNGQRTGFLAFIEGGQDTKRPHIHIVAQCPIEVSEERFRFVVSQICTRLDWVHDRIDVRKIEDIEGSGTRATIFYSLKEGVGAFCSEASCLPRTQNLLVA